MNKLNLPPFPADVQRRAGKLYIWDILRRKYVRLTPEEWVRQHFTHYLIAHLSYPPNLLMHEVGLDVGKTKKRIDGILYSRQLEPQLLLEYKAPEVAINDKTLQQALRYNYSLRVPYLILSNGITHHAYHIDYEGQTYTQLTNIPIYTDL